LDATLEFPYKGKRASVAMEWRLLYQHGSWLAYDLITDQQSMLETYRAELDKIITNRSFDDLLGRMKRRLAQTE
jgi:ABC-type transporter MlaC component